MIPPDDVTGPDALDLLLRYAKGDVSAGERVRVETAMARDPRIATGVAAARAALWAKEGQLEKAWATIDGVAATPEKPAAPRILDLPAARGYPSIFRQTRGWLWAGAAVVVFGAVILLRPGTPNTGVTRRYATGPNQQAHVTLVDGTNVTLAANTTVQLENFGTRTRTVSLVGEAFFEVPHTVGAPFLVRSGAATTRVLGTAFLVRHSGVRATTHVAVEQGRVSLAAGASSHVVTITAGGAAEANDSTVQLSGSDANMGTRWMNGKLLFHNASLSDIFAALRQWYGYEFRVADKSLLQRRFTLGLTARSSAAAFSNLEQVLGVTISVVGDTVTLTPQHSKPAFAPPRMRAYETWTPNAEAGR
jgi:transmembrane sensor